MPKRKTNEEFQQEIKDMVGDEYTFLDTYVNTSTKIKVKHNICGNTYKVTPNHFLRGSRCPYCFGKVKKKQIVSLRKRSMILLVMNILS